MIERELKKEAEDYMNRKMKKYDPYERFCCGDVRGNIFQAYLASAKPREKRIAELEQENERIKTKYYELQKTLKKVRLALIQERTANIMNYGKGGVEMFNNMFEILKGVSN
jgi:hypothetical protein